MSTDPLLISYTNLGVAKTINIPAFTVTNPGYDTGSLKCYDFSLMYDLLTA
jgi:hypothetical protein